MPASVEISKGSGNLIIRMHQAKLLSEVDFCSTLDSSMLLFYYSLLFAHKWNIQNLLIENNLLEKKLIQEMGEIPNSVGIFPVQVGGKVSKISSKKMLRYRITCFAFQVLNREEEK